MVIDDVFLARGDAGGLVPDDDALVEKAYLPAHLHEVVGDGDDLPRLDADIDVYPERAGGLQLAVALRPDGADAAQIVRVALLADLAGLEVVLEVPIGRGGDGQLHGAVGYLLHVFGGAENDAAARLAHGAARRRGRERELRRGALLAVEHVVAAAAGHGQQALDDAPVAEHDVAGDVGAAVVLCRYPDVAGVLAAGVVVLGPLAPLDVLPDVLFADGVLVEGHLRVIFAEPDDVLGIVREGAALCLRHRVDDGVDVVITGGGGGGDDVEEVMYDVAHGVVFRAHQGEEAAAAGEAGVFCFQERRRFFIAGVGYHGLHQRMLSNLALAMSQ